MNLAEICGVHFVFKIFCEIFEEVSVSISARAYADNDGFGAQFAIEGTMDLKTDDFVEDLIGWPEVSTGSFSLLSFKLSKLTLLPLTHKDNNVELVLEMEIDLKGNKLQTCVVFEDNRFCTGEQWCNIVTSLSNMILDCIIFNMEAIYLTSSLILIRQMQYRRGLW